MERPCQSIDREGVDSVGASAPYQNICPPISNDWRRAEGKLVKMRFGSAADSSARDRRPRADQPATL